MMSVWLLLGLALADDPLPEALDALMAARMDRLFACVAAGETGEVELQAQLHDGRIERVTVLRVDEPLAEERVCFAQAVSGAKGKDVPLGSFAARYVVRVGAAGVEIGPRLPAVALPALDRAVVDRRIARRQAGLDACIAKGRETKPTLSGELVVRLGIDPRGRVVHAETDWSTLKHAATERCILDVLETARFPSHEGKGVLVLRYPLKFDLPDR